MEITWFNSYEYNDDKYEWGAALEKTKEKYLSEWFIDYIAKPFNRE